MPRLAVVLVPLVAAVPLLGQAPDDAKGIEFFEKKIRPVLQQHCYECHSVESGKNKGKLLLDTRDATRKGGETGPAVVPGKPDESWLIKAVRHSELDLHMPPKGKLPPEAIADLEKWVAMGAPDPRTGPVAKDTKYGPSVEEGRKFWAFQPVKKQSLPAVNNKDWPRGGIDRFVLAKLESKGLKPAADADRATLLRRVYFALVGIPPSPAEIDAFLADDSPQAFEKVVDRLLASPLFGERWGRFWLDVARYAESTGGGRSLLIKDAWRYRDYIIAAFNSDLPYNQFLLEQIAGDLLPARTDEERYERLVATAYLLLGPHNYEKQDKPVLELDIIDEMLDTLGKSVLGMTIGCARCHDHKFDPIPTKDYYALAGIFKSTKFIVHDNVSKWNVQQLPMTADLAKAIKDHDAAVAALKAKIEVVKAAEKKAGKNVESTFTKGAIDPKALPGIVVDDEDAKRVGSWKHSVHSGNFIGKGYLYDDQGFKDDKTLTFIPEIAKAGIYEVRFAYVPHENRATKVAVRVFHADGEKTVYVNQRETPPIDGRFVSLGKYRFEPGNQWFVMVLTEKANGHVVADAVQFLPEEQAEETKPAKAPPKDAKDSLPDSRALEADLKKLLAQAPERPTAVAVAEGDKPVNLHVCVRGNYHNKGETVPRGFLQVLTPPGEKALVLGKGSGRKELAEWLVRPDNPLPARVMVNRIWHHLFGAGLVRTVDNLGATGEPPSHPELLDYLAARFVEEGWSVKKLIREIVLSHTYQISATPDPTSAKMAEKIDPENRLLWKMNRRRLDAEALRDTMLLVAGTLDLTAGGPGMKKGTAVERDYVFHDSRRSVYTPVFRNRTLELFEVFDFADPNVCNGRRTTSTVATQALFLMNSPFVMDQAKAAAVKLLAVPGLDDAGRVELMYRTALGRPPSAKERQLALTYLANEPAPRDRAWERLQQAVFGCIDFRYVN
jgi:hypothetical protein